MRCTGSWLSRGNNGRGWCGRLLLRWRVLRRHAWRLRGFGRWNLVFRMGHLVVGLRGFQISVKFRLLGRPHSGSRRHWLCFSVGGDGEAAGLHLVRLLAIALMPHGSNFRLLALLSVSFGNLRLTSPLLLNVRLDYLRRRASREISMLALFQQ